jgi:hypothetical protein
VSRTAVRRISAYDDNPQKLIEQLSRLEDSTTSELASLDDWKLDRFEPAPIMGVAYTAKIGQLVVADTSRHAVLIDLPIATAQNAGKQVAIAKTSASYALTARAIGQTVCGATTDTLPAANTVYLYLSTGSAWLRTG